MEQTRRKRGQPKLYLTKEMMDERRLLKRLCKNTCRNLQDDLHCRRPEGEGASSAERGTGVRRETGSGLAIILDGTCTLKVAPTNTVQTPAIAGEFPENMGRTSNSLL
ncbi:hypothetical protein POM88_010986 [Heracleum sosnowskyi]|uniref:Uncharacterized protein n=1 Tax=Heracleum sosnowskyi TaxID=360622 RepID=A0AAD8IXJ6_9APIA|nr:hypothetical protein POM88_010986 [Heracleum sosnowskyi]